MARLRLPTCARPAGSEYRQTKTQTGSPTTNQAMLQDSPRASSCIMVCRVPLHKLLRRGTLLDFGM